MASVLRAETKRWLVEQAEETLDQVKERDGFHDQTSQLRNLVQIVQEESEIAVLSNFIRYQTGRKTTHKFWNLIHQDVLRILKEIGTRPDLAEENLRKTAIQQFFGYLVRHYVYLDKLTPRPQRAGGRR